MNDMREEHKRTAPGDGCGDSTNLRSAQHCIISTICSTLYVQSLLYIMRLLVHTENDDSYTVLMYSAHRIYNMQYKLYNVCSLQHSHHTTYTRSLTYGRSINDRPWRWLRRFYKLALTATLRKKHNKYNMLYILYAESVVHHATSSSC